MCRSLTSSSNTNNVLIFRNRNWKKNESLRAKFIRTDLDLLESDIAECLGRTYPVISAAGRHGNIKHMKQLGYLRYMDLVDLDWMSFCFVSVLSLCLNTTYFFFFCVFIEILRSVNMFQQRFAIIMCTIHRMTDCNALILNYKVH